MMGIRILLAGVLLAFPMFMFSQGMMGNGNGYGMGMMRGYYNDRGEALEKSEAVKSVLAKIRKEQGLNEEEPIDPEKVSPKLLGELGDAVMDVMIGNKEQHEWMDNMMGGEGSASLERMHEQMGYRYLHGQPIGIMGRGYGPGYGGMMGYYSGFYGNNPYMPMMSFGSFMGTGTLMDMNWMLDYRFAGYLSLSKDQVKKITDLKSDYEKETDSLRSQLLEKRRNLFDLWSTAKPDESAIKTANKDIFMLLASLSDRETDYQIKVLEILTPDQRKKMDYRGMMNYQSNYTNN